MNTVRKTLKQSSDKYRIAYKLQSIITDDTPYLHHIFNIYQKVATTILGKMESKVTAFDTLLHKIKGDCNKTTQRTLIYQQFLYNMIAHKIYGTKIQKTYIFPKTLEHCDQSNLVQHIIDYMGSYDYHIFYIVTQPKNESDTMITRNKWYKTVKNTLDLRRYPKSVVKSTGLTLLPDIGNYKKWYYGILTNTESEAKVNLIPYLSGDSVSLCSDTLNEIKELPIYSDKQLRTLTSIGQQWNIDEFKQARQPIDIGLVQDRLAFLNPMPNVVNLPIKMEGSDTLYIPVEYEGMVEALSKIMSYEKAVNPSYDEYYAYMTIDKSYVKTGSSQSRFIYHVDGYQSAEQTAMTVQRNYYVTDIVPNIYVVDPMETNGLLGDTVGEWFDSFTHQSQHVDTMKAIPLHIYHYDGYQVHSPMKALATTDKTTLKVSFTRRKLNQIGNGINPLIDYEWTYIPNKLEAEVTA